MHLLLQGAWPSGTKGTAMLMAEVCLNATRFKLAVGLATGTTNKESWDPITIG